MLVPVVSRAEPVFRVVQMDGLAILKTDNIVGLCKGPVDRLLHMEIIASCICVTGVETYCDTVLLLNGVVYLLDLLELWAHAVAGARHVFQADLKVVFGVFRCLVERVANSLQSDLSTLSKVAAEMCD